MSDRIEKFIAEYVTAQIAKRPEAVQMANGFLGKPGFTDSLAAAVRAGIAFGAAHHRDERDPEWHEPIISKEQTRE